MRVVDRADNTFPDLWLQRLLIDLAYLRSCDWDLRSPISSLIEMPENEMSMSKADIMLKNCTRGLPYLSKLLVLAHFHLRCGKRDDQPLRDTVESNLGSSER